MCLLSTAAKSLFSLVKSNNGDFKSNKQGEFLRGVMGDTFTYVKHFNLGYDYNNKSCGTNTYTFYMDVQGIYKVTKENKKGLVTTFKRLEGEDLTKVLQAKQERLNLNKKVDLVAKRIDELMKLKDIVKDSFMSDLIGGSVKTEDIPSNRKILLAQTIDTNLNRLEHKFNKLQLQY